MSSGDGDDDSGVNDGDAGDRGDDDICDSGDHAGGDSHGDVCDGDLVNDDSGNNPGVGGEAAAVTVTRHSVHGSWEPWEQTGLWAKAHPGPGVLRGQHSARDEAPLGEASGAKDSPLLPAQTWTGEETHLL